MKMTLLDKSECFRGFLVLIGRDGRISSSERELLLEIGKMLDFERRFCESSVDDLLENHYINSNVPVFSDPLIARGFLMDAVRVAVSDDLIDSSEAHWLASAAEMNGVEVAWLDDEIANLRGRRGHAVEINAFAIRQYV